MPLNMYILTVKSLKRKQVMKLFFRWEIEMDRTKVALRRKGWEIIDISPSYEVYLTSSEAIHVAEIFDS